MIGLGASLAVHLRNGHFACFGKQLCQMALVTRIEVLNQHECHAGIVRQMAEQLRECLQAAGGGAYANNRDCVELPRRLAARLPRGRGEVFVGSSLWRGESAARGERRPPGRRLPVFFATHTITFLAGTNGLIAGTERDQPARGVPLSHRICAGADLGGWHSQLTEL